MAAAVAALKQVLQDASVRIAASETLGRLGRAGVTADVLIALGTALRDEDWRVRLSSAEALKSLASAAAGLDAASAQLEHWPLAGLAAVLQGDEEWLPRAAAGEALAVAAGIDASLALGIATRHGTDIVAVLRDEHEEARRGAWEALAALGALAVRLAAPELCTDDPEVLVALARLLSCVVERQPGLAAMAADVGAVALARRIRHTAPAVRSAVAGALGLLGEPAAAAIQNAGLLSQDEADEDARLRAVEVIASLGPAAGATAEAVAALLDSEDEDLRRAAAEALGALGASASALYVRALADRLHDEDEDVACAAASALAALEDPTLLTHSPSAYETQGSDSARLSLLRWAVRLVLELELQSISQSVCLIVGPKYASLPRRHWEAWGRGRQPLVRSLLSPFATAIQECAGQLPRHYETWALTPCQMVPCDSCARY